MGKLRGIAAVVALSATVSGCWLQSGFNAAKTGHNGGESTVTTANVADLEVDWSTDVGTDASEALIRDGTAYVRSDGAVTALDLATGDVQWSVSEIVSPDGTPVPLGGNAVPAIAEGALWVPVDFDLCVVVGLDLGTGELIRGQAFGPPSHYPPHWEVGCTTGDALEIGGAVMVPYNWIGSGAPLRPELCPEPTEWLAFQGLGVVDITGNTEWNGVHEVPGGCGPLPSLPLYGPASVSGSEMLVPKGGTLSAYPLSGCPAGTTCPSWSRDFGVDIVGPPVALAGGDIAVGLSDGHSQVIDGTTHATEWTLTPFGTTAAPLAATDELLYFSMSTGFVGAVPIAGCGQASCSPDLAFTVPGGASARPSIGGDVLYVGSADGTVTAVPADCDPSPCQKLFTHGTGNRITGAPTIYGGTLLVGSENGTVTAFRLPD